MNHFIQIPDAAGEQLEAALAKLPEDWRKDPRTVVLPGYDGITGTADDLVQRLKDGVPIALEIPGEARFEEAAAIIERLSAKDGRLPAEAEVSRKLENLRDPWGSPLRYAILNSSKARLISDGPDRTPDTRWDIGMTLEIPERATAGAASWTDAFHPDEPWLARRKHELGIPDDTGEKTDAAGFRRTAFCGGQTRLHGAAYFRFFTWLMLGTAVAFIPYAMLYRPKTYLQD